VGFHTRQVLKEVARQSFKRLGSKLGASLFSDEANGPEKYADRIKRDFRIPDYADAWALYTSDPAYWERYYDPPPNEPAAADVMVRDSATHANIRNRNNVFEYDFPGPSSKPLDRVNGGADRPGAFGTGVSPMRFVPPVIDNVPRGLPGLLVEAGLNDPQDPDLPRAGGLGGLIQEYLRNNSLRSN
jgi:hypothetical protein